MQIRMNVLIEEKLYNSFKVLVEKDGRTISGLVRLLIKNWMEGGEAKKGQATYFVMNSLDYQQKMQ